MMKAFGTAVLKVSTLVVAISVPGLAQARDSELPYRYTEALTTVVRVESAMAQAPADAGPASPTSHKASVTARQLQWRNAMIVAGGVGLVATYGLRNWWQDGFQGEFRTVSEKWFGKDTQYGGADKLGHAYFSYAGARVLTAAFSAVGNDAGSASTLGALWSLGVMTGVEVADGFSRRYRFSTEDALMNLAGAAAGYIMERSPRLDALIDLRLHYRPSQGGQFNIGGDYSGQTYVLAVKASGIPSLRANNMLRYFELAVGYGTRGFESPPHIERSRNFYFGISLNLSELLSQTAYRENRQPTPIQRTTDLFFELVQLPGTAVPLAKHQF